MKKQFLFLAMCIATILSANGQTSVWDGSHTTWTNGNGTQANPYLIENAAQLAHLAYIVNNGIGADNVHIVGTNTYLKLMTDIDLNGSESFQWIPIGSLNYEIPCVFGGYFDGNNHTIANLYINGDGEEVGLFGRISSGSIKNVGIISGSITTTGIYSFTGGIAGIAENNIVIDNCYNKVNISSASSSGGIVGVVQNGNTISNCYNSGNIYSSTSSSSCNSGGIIGRSDSSIGVSTFTIYNCYNTGNISSTSSIYDSYSGGIAGGQGTMYSTFTIQNCYSTGNISSMSSYKGGIANNSNTSVMSIIK